MSQEEALDALRAGNFEKAAGLLGTLVEENRFSSDVLNHAYTVALHQTNSPALRDASFMIGRSLSARNPGLAADYFQRAILTGIDLEKSSRDLRLARVPGSSRSAQGRVADIHTDRVAHVIGCFLPGHAPSLYIQLLAKSLRQSGVESHVFTTEWDLGLVPEPTGGRSIQPTSD